VPNFIPNGQLVRPQWKWKKKGIRTYIYIYLQTKMVKIVIFGKVVILVKLSYKAGLWICCSPHEGEQKIYLPNFSISHRGRAGGGQTFEPGGYLRGSGGVPNEGIRFIFGRSIGTCLNVLT
jgi:hypothetical protein